MSDGCRIRRGFSLIELLLVIVLVGLLVALAMPPLGAVVESGRDLASLANMRTHAQTLVVYAGDYDGSFPEFVTPDADISVVRGCDQALEIPYFHAAYAWPIALCEGYYDGVSHGAAFSHPMPSQLGITSYLMSSSLLATPAYWNVETRSGPEQWGVGRLDAVTFPSAKALFVEWHPKRGLPIRGPTMSDDPVALSFADGSAERLQAGSLTEPYPNGDGPWEGRWLPVGVYGMHTIDGWLGRDRK